jgi:hypothetical protein
VAAPPTRARVEKPPPDRSIRWGTEDERGIEWVLDALGGFVGDVGGAGAPAPDGREHAGVAARRRQLLPQDASGAEGQPLEVGLGAGGGVPLLQVEKVAAAGGVGFEKGRRLQVR